MKRVVPVLLVAMIASTALAQVVQLAVHLPVDGDRVTKTGYEWVEIPDGSCLWDLSHVVESGESHQMRWRVLGDSLFVCNEAGWQRTYTLRGDTLWHISSETRLTGLRDSARAATMRFPLAVGDTLRTPFYYHGRYSDNNAVAETGWCRVEAIAVGTLVLPNDTVFGVTLIGEERDSRVRVSPFAEAAAISYQTDSLTHHLERVLRWYAPGYRYPLAESRESVFSTSGTAVSHSRTLHLCCPAEQEYALGPVRHDAMRFTSDTDHQGFDASQMRDSRPLDGALAVSNDEGTVGVEYTAMADCRVTVMLADALGRVYSSQRSVTAHAGERVSSRIPTTCLPKGHYLLYVSDGAGANVERIIIK